MVALYRIWQYHTQNTARQRFHHYQLSPWYSHCNDAFKNDGGALCHFHNTPRRQNRNCSAQKGRAEARESEEVLCSARTTCLWALHLESKYHLPRKLEFFGGSICVVYNLHNDRFWRLCAYGITAEGNRSWRGLAYSPVRLFCAFVVALPFWFEPVVVYLELPRWLCGWNTQFPGTRIKLLPKFAFTCAKVVLPQNGGLSRQWLIRRFKLEEWLTAYWNFVISRTID